MRLFEFISILLEYKRDINKYTFRSLEDEIDKIYNADITSKDDATENDPVESIPNVKILYKGPLGSLAVPETEEASKILGKGTKWCTAADNNNMFDEYNKAGPLYVWKDKSGKKYQFHFVNLEFMDDKNDPILPNLLDEFRTRHPILSKLFRSEEKAIASRPIGAYYYAKDVIKGRWPEGEKVIA